MYILTHPHFVWREAFLAVDVVEESRVGVEATGEEVDSAMRHVRVCRDRE